MRSNQSTPYSPSSDKQSPISYHHSSLEHQSLSSSSQYIIVNSKKSKSHSNYKKPTEKTRIFLPELVQVVDIPPELQNEQVKKKFRQILARSCYYGKYGKVNKIIINQKPTESKPSKKNYVAYITYENAMNVALAISMQIFHHQTFKCYANYGTTRYCARMLNNKSCTFKDCFYIHEITKDNILVDDKQQINVQETIKRAKRLIASDLVYYIQKERKQYLQKKQDDFGLVKCNCYWVEENKRDFIEFPTIGETIKYLIEEKFAQQKQYQRLKEEYKAQFRLYKQPQQKSELKSLVNDFIKSRPVSLSYSNYLSHRYFSKEPKDRALTPKSQKIQDYYVKRSRQMSKNIFRYKKIVSRDQSAKREDESISSKVYRRLLQFLKRDRSKVSIFEFAQDVNESGAWIKDLIQKSLMKGY